MTPEELIKKYHKQYLAYVGEADKAAIKLKAIVELQEWKAEKVNEILGVEFVKNRDSAPKG